MKAFIEIKQFVTVEIPNDKLSQVLKPYQRIVLNNGDEKDLAEHIAYTVAVNDTSFVEGVGDVNIGNKDENALVNVIYRSREIEIESEIEETA